MWPSLGCPSSRIYSASCRGVLIYGREVPMVYHIVRLFPLLSSPSAPLSPPPPAPRIHAEQDMAGLLKPRAAPLLVEAIRSVTNLPIHFHTHATSSCSLATALEMARAGCDIIDFATASMADCTSQPR